MQPDTNHTYLLYRKVQSATSMVTSSQPSLPLVLPAARTGMSCSGTEGSVDF